MLEAWFRNRFPLRLPPSLVSFFFSFFPSLLSDSAPEFLGLAASGSPVFVFSFFFFPELIPGYDSTGPFFSFFFFFFSPFPSAGMMPRHYYVGLIGRTGV